MEAHGGVQIPLVSSTAGAARVNRQCPTPLIPALPPRRSAVGSFLLLLSLLSRRPRCLSRPSPRLGGGYGGGDPVAWLVVCTADGTPSPPHPPTLLLPLLPPLPLLLGCCVFSLAPPALSLLLAGSSDRAARGRWPAAPRRGCGGPTELFELPAVVAVASSLASPRRIHRPHRPTQSRRTPGIQWIQ